MLTIDTKTNFNLFPKVCPKFSHSNPNLNPFHDLNPNSAQIQTYPILNPNQIKLHQPNPKPNQTRFLSSNTIPKSNFTVVPIGIASFRLQILDSESLLQCSNQIYLEYSDPIPNQIPYLIEC